MVSNISVHGFPPVVVSSFSCASPELLLLLLDFLVSFFGRSASSVSCPRDRLAQVPFCFLESSLFDLATCFREVARVSDFLLEDLDEGSMQALDCALVEALRGLLRAGSTAFPSSAGLRGSSELDNLRDRRRV